MPLHYNKTGSPYHPAVVNLHRCSQQQPSLLCSALSALVCRLRRVNNSSNDEILKSAGACGIKENLKENSFFFHPARKSMHCSHFCKWNFTKVSTTIVSLTVRWLRRFMVLNVTHNILLQLFLATSLAIGRHFCKIIGSIVVYIAPWRQIEYRWCDA